MQKVPSGTDKQKAGLKRATSVEGAKKLRFDGSPCQSRSAILEAQNHKLVTKILKTQLHDRHAAQLSSCMDICMTDVLPN
eukprot:11286909-Karenia_brevis.AAC.1